MLTTTQCQKPLPVGASGSKHVIAKLWVPSGAPDQAKCGEVFRPLQTEVRRRRLAEHFPGERTADVLLRVADHRRVAAQRERRQLTWGEALDSLKLG